MDTSIIGLDGAERMTESGSAQVSTPRRGYLTDGIVVQNGNNILAFLPRFDPEKSAFLFGGEHVKQPIGALANVTNTLLEFHEQRFASQFFPPLVKDDPLNLSGAWNAAFAESANKEVSLPVRKTLARVECHAGHTNRR